jgi:hypothetical protein
VGDRVVLGGRAVTVWKGELLPIDITTEREKEGSA